jgi:hypothetical protein
MSTTKLERRRSAGVAIWSAPSAGQFAKRARSRAARMKSSPRSPVLRPRVRWLQRGDHASRFILSRVDAHDGAHHGTADDQRLGDALAEISVCRPTQRFLVRGSARQGHAQPLVVQLNSIYCTLLGVPPCRSAAAVQHLRSCSSNSRQHQWRVCRSRPLPDRRPGFATSRTARGQRAELLSRMTQPVQMRFFIAAIATHPDAAHRRATIACRIVACRFSLIAWFNSATLPVASLAMATISCDAPTERPGAQAPPLSRRA